MIDYGVKASAMIGLQIYNQASRGSGRTISMLERMKDGDVAIVHTPAAAKWLLHRAHEMKKKVKIHVADNIRTVHTVTQGNRPSDEIFIDHWVFHLLYQEGLNEVEAFLNHIQKLNKKNPSIADRVAPVAEFIRGRTYD